LEPASFSSLSDHIEIDVFIDHIALGTRELIGRIQHVDNSIVCVRLLVMPFVVLRVTPPGSGQSHKSAPRIAPLRIDYIVNLLQRSTIGHRLNFSADAKASRTSYIRIGASADCKCISTHMCSIRITDFLPAPTQLCAVR
jgi:hypothetical protein